jgi:hypothetical protein
MSGALPVYQPDIYRLTFLLIFEYKKESAETELGEMRVGKLVPLHFLTSASVGCLRLERKTVKP